MKHFLLLALVTLTMHVHAQWALRLPALLSDHAVLQHSSNVKLWGWAQSGSTVKISCSWNATDTIRVEPQKNWTWQTTVKTPKAGGPYSITFSCSNQKITIHDILLGEVWLCSGQSNMEYAFNWEAGVLDAGDELANSQNNQLRFFQLAHSYSMYPKENSDGEWKISSPSTTASMSVVAYFFGKTIEQKLKTPVGLIASYWGGSSVQAWTPQWAYTANDSLNQMAQKLKAVNWAPVEPSNIYNSMMHPLKNYRIAGAIWYQGESNTDDPQYYGPLFKNLILAWRKDFGHELPFYYVQIAPWSGYKPLHGAYLREQQQLALSLPQTGMVAVSDLVDDINDIHPRIKKEVGMRLVKLALSEQYHIPNLKPYHPTYKKHMIQNNKVTISFNRTGALTSKLKSPSNFELAGADNLFHPAKATIEKDGTISLTCKEQSKPLYVRYCFSNTAIPDIFDINGLALLPFRTDKINTKPAD